MLTIKRLAEYVGVTVRAVRHYHQTGLLPEPDRDGSGYRRYDARAVVDLIRIRTLAEAGVPLVRIHELMAADPAGFAAAVGEIDRDLARQIRELRDRRRRMADLVAGDRLFLPAEIVDYLQQLRDLGISERGVRMERDGWIVLAASYPDRAVGWIAQKRAQLADPEFRDGYLAYDRAHDWAPTDPRLVDLAAVLADRLVRDARAAGVDPREWVAQEVLSADEQSLLGAHVRHHSPAWIRVHELLRERLARPTSG